MWWIILLSTLLRKRAILAPSLFDILIEVLVDAIAARLICYCPVKPNSYHHKNLNHLLKK